MIPKIEKSAKSGSHSSQRVPAQAHPQYRVMCVEKVFFALFSRLKKVRHFLRSRAHGRRHLLTSLCCDDDVEHMEFGGSASGSRLASSIAGGCPWQTDPRLTIQSGGPRGSSGVDQGDLEPSGSSSWPCGLCTCWCSSCCCTWSRPGTSSRPCELCTRWRASCPLVESPCEHAAQVPAVFAD